MFDIEMTNDLILFVLSFFFRCSTILTRLDGWRRDVPLLQNVWYSEHAKWDLPTRTRVSSATKGVEREGEEEVETSNSFRTIMFQCKKCLRDSPTRSLCKEISLDSHNFSFFLLPPAETDDSSCYFHCVPFMGRKRERDDKNLNNLWCIYFVDEIFTFWHFDIISMIERISGTRWCARENMEKIVCARSNCSPSRQTSNFIIRRSQQRKSKRQHSSGNSC